MVGEIIQKIGIYDIPNESEGHEVINASPGTSVRVLHRGGQWYQVEGKATDGTAVQGWVYKDWIRIAPEDEVRIQPNPSPLPVITSKITQSVGSDGKKYWSGTVMNIGTKIAYDVQVEITINGYVTGSQTIVDRQSAFVATHTMDPGQSAEFVVTTVSDNGNDAGYSYDVRWTEQ